jgi:hypothetical protein
MIDRAGRWVAAEHVRAARSGEIAARHEELATKGPPALCEFHRHAAVTNRQIQKRHIVSAGMQATHLARLRALARRIIDASPPDELSIPSPYGLVDVREGRGSTRPAGHA